MTTLGHMIWAELLKLKRTLALWLVGLAPLTLVLLFVLIIGASGMSPGEAGWGMIGRQAVGMWAFFMLPLFIALETALLNGIDHKEHAWKRLYTLPIPRWTVYAAKLLIALVLVGVSSLLLSVSLPLMFFVLVAIIY